MYHWESINMSTSWKPMTFPVWASCLVSLVGHFHQACLGTRVLGWVLWRALLRESWAKVYYEVLLGRVMGHPALLRRLVPRWFQTDCLMRRGCQIFAFPVFCLVKRSEMQRWLSSTDGPSGNPPPVDLHQRRWEQCTEKKNPCLTALGFF